MAHNIPNLHLFEVIVKPGQVWVKSLCLSGAEDVRCPFRHEGEDRQANEIAAEQLNKMGYNIVGFANTITNKYILSNTFNPDI